MILRMARPLGRTLKAKVESYRFEVGILEDKPHRAPSKVLSTYAGGPARRASSRQQGTLAAVSAGVRAQVGNYLTKPFKDQKNAPAQLFKTFFELIFASNSASKRKRLENLIAAVVRNPILRGAYGRNKKITADNKGFNRKLIDTGQFVRNIKARVIFAKKRGR